MVETKSSATSEDAHSVAEEPVKTIYRPDIAARIKINVRRVWERVKQNKNLTQMNLAKALGTTQGAVSKLLNDDEGHPWTETHLRKFSEFCSISPRELVDNDTDLLGFFIGWDTRDDEPDQNLIEECIQALTKFYSDRGLPARRDKLTSLAARLAARLDGISPDAATMNAEVERVVLENALQ